MLQTQHSCGDHDDIWVNQPPRARPSRAASDSGESTKDEELESGGSEREDVKEVQDDLAVESSSEIPLQDMKKLIPTPDPNLVSASKKISSMTSARY